MNESKSKLCKILFLSLCLAAFSLGGIFLFYTGMCCAALLFVGLIVPETKNKSLEEISKDLKNK